MSDFDNEQDFTGAIIEKIKELFQNRIAVIIMAAVVAVIAIIIIIAAVASGNSAGSFDTPSVLAQTTGAEEKSLSFSKKGLSVAVRISDIRSFDRKTDESYTSLYYSDESDEKYVFADYIIKNRSSKDVTIECGTHSDGSLSLHLGYFHDASAKVDDNNNNDFCAFYRLYDRASETAPDISEVVIGAGETKEFTLRYTMDVDRISRCNGVYFFEQWDVDDGYTKYAVMGVGKPVISYGFKNSELFPQLINDAAKEAEAAEAASAGNQDSSKNNNSGNSETTPFNDSTGSVSKYSMTKIDQSSPAFSFINNTASSPYKLSVEIAAQGNPASSFTAGVSGYAAAMDNESIQGPVVELKYTPGLEVEKVKIMFEIKPEARDNTIGTHTGVSIPGELEGIKRFNVFMFDEETNMSLPIETFFDLDNNIVYAETDRCGTYALVDMEIWFDMMGIELNQVD